LVYHGRMTQKDELSVSDDAGYHHQGGGPAPDTQVFHQATPGPAERAGFGSGSLPPKGGAQTSSSRLPHIPIQRTVPPPDPHDEGGLSSAVVLGLSAFIATGIVAVGGLYFLFQLNQAPPPPPPEPEVQEVEGIEVHKGFKDPGIQ
jgi:hypothetical protein